MCALFLPEVRLQLAAVTLAEELNFTRAAERLKITQPVASDALMKINLLNLPDRIYTGNLYR
jgi:hypothetical protein